MFNAFGQIGAITTKYKLQILCIQCRNFNMISIEIAISFYPVHINIHLHRLLCGIEI